MTNLLLDTNIIVGLIRNKAFKDFFDEEYAKFDIKIISTVCVGELKSLAIQWQWGKQKTANLTFLLNEFTIIPIKVTSIINAYAQIDAFSQGKLLEQPLGRSARNMGKNDLWIAATAHVTNATLLTTDHDFDHLQATFLQLDTVDLAKYH